jgi:hypothetical protein
MGPEKNFNILPPGRIERAARFFKSLFRRKPQIDKYDEFSRKHGLDLLPDERQRLGLAPVDAAEGEGQLGYRYVTEHRDGLTEDELRAAEVQEIEVPELGLKEPTE